MELRVTSDEPAWAHFPGAAAVINAFHWDVSVREMDGTYELLNGVGVIATFDSMDELEIFTAGMALVLDVMPRRVRHKRP